MTSRAWKEPILLNPQRLLLLLLVLLQLGIEHKSIPPAHCPSRPVHPSAFTPRYTNPSIVALCLFNLKCFCYLSFVTHVLPSAWCTKFCTVRCLCNFVIYDGAVSEGNLQNILLGFIKFSSTLAYTYIYIYIYASCYQQTKSITKYLQEAFSFLILCIPWMTKSSKFRYQNSEVARFLLHAVLR
jgi:hypothetical protein